MSDALVRADLARRLPGGLPAMVWVVVRWSHGGQSGIAEWALEYGRLDEIATPRDEVLIPLPGPDGLNAAGLLVRLAESCDSPFTFSGHDWDLGVVLEVSNQCNPWRDLRRVVHHVGRLYAVAHAVGLEPVAGEWPDLTYWHDPPHGRRWVLECGDASEEVWTEGTEAPDPYEALKAVHEEVCGG